MNIVRCRPKMNNVRYCTYAPIGWLDKAAITSKWYEIGCQLILITDRKSHMGFRSIPASMILNDFERHNSFYFALFLTEFDSFAGQLRHSG